MLKLKKTYFALVVLFFIMLLFVNRCFAIDETQFSNIIQPNTSSEPTTQTENPTNAPSSIDINNTIPSESEDNTSLEQTNIDENQVSSSLENDAFEDNESTTVSSVTTQNSSFTNILNIVLIVVGILLILLAIAILIRIHS